MLFDYRSPRAADLGICIGKNTGDIAKDAYINNYDAICAAAILAANYPYEARVEVYLHASKGIYQVEYIAPPFEFHN